MFRNRILSPSPPASTPAPDAFALWPAPPGQCPDQWAWQQAVYQLAYAEAQAVVRPSLLERDLLGVWN